MSDFSRDVNLNEFGSDIDLSDGTNLAIDRETWDLLQAHGDLEQLSRAASPESVRRAGGTTATTAPARRRERIEGLLAVARSLVLRRRFDEVDAVVVRALDIGGADLEADRALLTALLSHAARSHEEQGRLAEAEANYRRALAHSLPAERGTRAKLLHNLAVLCEMSGRAEEAERLWADARGLLESAGGSPSSEPRGPSTGRQGEP
jgi:tetratricopeptide (TPR) repeat protein